jgi:hypothetical protein
MLPRVEHTSLFTVKLKLRVKKFYKIVDRVVNGCAALPKEAAENKKLFTRAQCYKTFTAVIYKYSK